MDDYWVELGFRRGSVGYGVAKTHEGVGTYACIA